MEQKLKNSNKALCLEYYKRLLREFDTHILSTKSIRRGNHYSGQVKRFLIYLENKGILHLSEVDGEVMKEYFAYLSTRPKIKKGTGPLSPISINDCLCTLRTFSMRMVKGGEIERGLQIPNPVKIEHKSNNPFVLTRQVLTVEELKQVYKRANSLIDKSIIALAYGCGLRRMELESLKDNDIDFRKGVLTIIESKNNKTRSVPISNFFLEVLKEYNYHRLEILSKRGKRTRYFLLNDLGDKLSGEIMNKRLKSVIAKTKDQSIIEKNITLHCLRHSIATHLVNSGESFEYVKVFLGHSMVDTTSLYAKRRKQKNKYQI